MLHNGESGKAFGTRAKRLSDVSAYPERCESLYKLAGCEIRYWNLARLTLKSYVKSSEKNGQRGKVYSKFRITFFIGLFLP